MNKDHPPQFVLNPDISRGAHMVLENISPTVEESHA